MGKARKKALQWFYDHGSALKELAQSDAPSAAIMRRMESDGQITLTDEGWCLTDRGRRDLWEAGR